MTGGVVLTVERPDSKRDRGVLLLTRVQAWAATGGCTYARSPPSSVAPEGGRSGDGRVAAAGSGRRPSLSHSRSKNVCPHRLTHDRRGLSVCRVPREPEPDWIIQRRRVIGDRVRVGREHANLSQEQLGHRSGVTRLTVQRIESGATDARIGWLLRIARVLDTPLADLLGDRP
ncbi:helix-turn-helix transcriptional regulator [Streptomyces sp. NPDC088794]|uniref:helix-turn-helix transcriptional regulator n=1 Tax=Streptomyces sp. NPDC088794 TaxID=3365902 RepID=UPI0037F1842A